MLIPLPGAGTAAMIAALVAQIPIYKSLAGELTRVYKAPHDNIVRGIVNSGLALDTTASVTAEFASQFGMSFAEEVGGEVLGELGLGFGLSWIPVVGGFVAIAFDVAIALTMTWRVGTMVSIYYQNGRRWVGDRYTTYEHAKEMTGGLSKVNETRVNLNAVPFRVKEVREHQNSAIDAFRSRLDTAAPNVTDEMIRGILQNKGDRRRACGRGDSTCAGRRRPRVARMELAGIEPAGSKLAVCA